MLISAPPQTGTPTTGTPPPTGGGITALGALTTIHFAIIGVLFALTLIAIIYGVRQARARRTAERSERDRLEERSREPTERRAIDWGPAAAPAAVERTAAAPASPTTQPGAPANGPLTQIKGLGPKVAARLGELGITNVGQIAALTDDEADVLDTKLGPFSGRIARDRWIEQARFLAAGDKAGFEAVFGRL